MAFDPNKASTRLGLEEEASANLAQSNGIAPSQAQGQLRTQRQTGVPPSQQKDMVVSNVDRAIPGPRTATFIAKSPVHAAAVQDDLGFFGTLERIGEGFRTRSRALFTNAEEVGRTLETGLDAKFGTLPGMQKRPDQVAADQAQARRIAAGRADEASYTPATSWDQVKKQPAAKLIPYILETGIVSVPDMALAIANLPTSIAVQAGRLSKDRSQNNNKAQPTVEDLALALPGAAASSLLDRFGGHGMLGIGEHAAEGAAKGGAKAAVKETVKGAAKAGLREGATEAAQEAIEYTTTNTGTDHGFHFNEMADQMAAAAVAGGGFGAATHASVDAAKALIGKEGVTPATAPAAKILAEHHEDNLAAAQHIAAQTPSIMNDPDLVGEFFDDHDDEPDVLSIDPRGILEIWETGEQPFAHRAEEIKQALEEGGEIEIPLGEYLAATTGKPWADKLNEWTAPVGGYSSRALDELMELNEDVGLDGKDDPVLEAPEDFQSPSNFNEVKHGFEVIEQIPTANKDADGNWLDDELKFTYMPWESKAVASDGSFVSADVPNGFIVRRVSQSSSSTSKQFLGKDGFWHSEEDSDSANAQLFSSMEEATAAAKQLAQKHAGVEDRAEKQQKLSDMVEEGGWESLDEVDYDEDVAAAMGVSSGSFFHEFGKKYLEPEDLEMVEQLDEIEQKQFAAQLVEAHDVLKKIVQEQYLTKLFKTPKAAGMTNSQFAMYSKKIEAAMEKLTEKLWKQTYNDVKKQYTREWNAAYQNHFQSTMNEIMGSPEMVAEHALRFSQAIVDELAKTKIRGPDGKPATLIHGADYANIGTPENPWKPKGYDGISASYDPEFAVNWKNGKGFNPYDSSNYSDHPYNEESGQGLTFYVLNFLAENPADFENKADVEKAADWYIEKGTSEYSDYNSKIIWKGMPEHSKRYAMQNYGLEYDAPGSEELYWQNVRADIVKALSQGRYRMWENKHMAKDLGWDAVHMKEHADSPSKNVFVFSGKQVFFRYREEFEKRGFKIDTAAKKLYPTEMWEGLPNSMFSKDGGQMPDDLAGEFGFDNGEQMLKALTASQVDRGDRDFRSHVTRKIKDTARLRTMQEVGDLLNPDKIHMMASALFSAPPVTDILIDQLRVLAETSGQPFSAADIEAHAEVEFNAMPMRQATNIRAWERRMHVNGRVAEMNIEKDPIAAFEAKQKQVLNHHKLIMAHDLQRLLARTEKHWKTWAAHDTMTNTDQDYLNHIHAVLTRLGFNVKRKPDELLRSLNGQTLEAFYNDRQDFVYYDAPLWKKPQAMSVEEFTNLAGMMKSLGQAGRDAQVQVVNGQRVYRDALIERMKHDGRDLPPVPPDLNVGDEKKIPESMKLAGYRMDAWHRKMENMVKLLDNGNTLGVWHQVFLKPAHEAANHLGRLTREIGEKVIEAYKKIPESLQDKYGLLMDDHPFTIIGPDGQPQKVKVYRKHMLSVILNLGNEYNARVLAEGYNTTEQEVLAWVLKHSTEEEWQFAQTVGDIMTDELWPQLDEVTRATRGIGLSRVEPRTVNGYKGWYFPVFHHPRLDNEAEARSADTDQDPLKNFYEILGVPNGMTKARTGYTGPLWLDTDKVLFRHLENTYIHIAYGQYIKNVRSWMGDKRVRSYVREKLGQPYLSQFMPWVRDQIRSPSLTSAEDQMWNDIGRFFRGNWNKTVMLLSRSVMFSQVAGITNSSGMLAGKGKQMAKGMWLFGDIVRKHGGNMPAIFHDMFERSEYLRERFDGALQRETWETRQQMRRVPSSNRLLRNVAKANDKWDEIAGKSIGFMDAFFVAMPTWLAAYDEAKAMDYSESDCVFYADQMVIASQGSGRNIDMARIQRPVNEIAKFFTMAMSYSNALYNQQISIGRAFKQGRIAEGTAMAMFILCLGPMAARLVTQDLPDEDEDMDRWLFNSIFFNLFGGIFGVRDAALTLGRFSEGEFAKFGGTPLASAQEPLGKVYKAIDRAVKGKPFELSETPIKNTITSLGFMLGIPAGANQLGKDAQFWWDYANGEIDPNEVNWSKAVFGGKWETKAGGDEEEEQEFEEEPEPEYVDDE